MAGDRGRSRSSRGDGRVWRWWEFGIGFAFRRGPALREPTPPSYETESAKVLRAYRASWGAFDQAQSTANAYDQELAATMVGTQLQNVRANLLGDRTLGSRGRGSVTLHPKIASLSATTASVIDCAYSTSELIYAKSGKPVPPITPPESDGIQATLVLTGGMWKVSQQNVTEGHCASDS